MTDLKPGDLLLIGEACSVQFAGDRALRLRLVSVDPRPTYHGWVWLTGYVLNDKGLAVDKREVFVQQAGLVSAAVPRTGVRKRPSGYSRGDTAWVPPSSSATTHSTGGV
ncbi:hypothetical protein [Micromonospora ureilytica]|uniref:hypothetical protein n=1 Tax=Micromonospora ureilytica TaxID=709868 RepID=UPI001F0C79E8|nr:hypothetical protein [Micromonospora ureilytica]